MAILTHIGAMIDYKGVSRMLPSGVEMAWDGMGVEI